MPPSICALMMSGLTATPQSPPPPPDRADDAFDLGLALRHRHLGDMSDELWKLSCTATPRNLAAGEASVQLRLFRGELQHAGVARLVLEQSEAEFGTGSLPALAAIWSIIVSTT